MQDFTRKYFSVILFQKKKYSGWFHQNLFWLITAACLYHGFLPETLFQRHPSRKYFNDGFYQKFLKVRRCFRPEFRNFFKVGFDQKKNLKKSKIYDAHYLFWWITAPCSNSGAFTQKIFQGRIQPEKIWQVTTLCSNSGTFTQKMWQKNSQPEK